MTTGDARWWWIVLPASLAVLAALATVPYIARRRTVRGAAWYALLLLAIAEWIIAHTASILVDEAWKKELLEKIKYFGVETAPVAFFLFSMRFSRRETWRRPLWFGLIFGVPIATLLLVWTNGLHHWVWTEFRSTSYGSLEVPSASLGPWFGVNAIYCYFISTAGVVTLLLRLSATHLRFRFPLVAVLAFPLVVGTVNLSFLSGVGGVVVDYTPVAYAACAVLMALALFRDDLFELLPVARSAVLDALTEVVIAVDRSGRVVDVNRAATAVLAAPATSLVGESLERLVPELTPAVTELSRPVEVTLARAPERTFELRTSRFGFEGDEVAGQLLVMRDISMRKQAEGELHAAREKLEEANRELRRLVDTDVLTGLSNRRYLMAKLDAEVRRARRNKKAVALIVLDLDRFKTINDRYGHAVGDQVLVGCAEVLAAAKRANDIAARYGGEEFVVLLPETDAEGALVFAQRLRKDLNSRTFAAAENTRFRVTASYGVAAMPGDQVDVEELLRLGDLRMYRAKEEGRDRICATGGELRTNFAEAAGGG